uniref:Uncharacterized protein n=1 Tax=Arundo donax TaxID=35708 RepID=A0A0A9C5Y9_ARUDO
MFDLVIFVPDKNQLFLFRFNHNLLSKTNTMFSLYTEHLAIVLRK